MSLNFEFIVGARVPEPTREYPLHSVAATRALEQHSPPPAGQSSQMQLAGLAVAQLALATTPHAKTIWVACGPGNNGGDGLVAAAHLRQWGKEVLATEMPGLERTGDAALARQMAQDAQVRFSSTAPVAFDTCIDALFGIGAVRPLANGYAQWAQAMNASGKPVVGVDLPSGLDADTGTLQDLHVRATHTLSLLTLKPGLFTAQGRDTCGDIWFNSLGYRAPDTACATIVATPTVAKRRHASHKGSFGDVCIVGGAPGMVGAALLAAGAALRGGAGRVYLHLLEAQSHGYSDAHPEWMFRDIRTLDLAHTSVVAGCGGGREVVDALPQLLREAQALVLDADALNQIAESADLQQALARRSDLQTILTPHPLEAARLLGLTTAQVQAKRLQAAQTLAERFGCVVALKGSGTVVASPKSLPAINNTGNAKLATAGTGDVLAGLAGAYLANGLDALEAARQAVYRHGIAANRAQGPSLSASDLIHQL